jgi:hypothetical protein
MYQNEDHIQMFLIVISEVYLLGQAQLCINLLDR